MSIRVAIILSGSILVSAAGGLLAGLPVLLATDAPPVPVERALTPELEQSRQTVLASLRASRESVSVRLAELELLAELMAARAAAESDLLPDRPAAAAAPGAATRVAR